MPTAALGWVPWVLGLALAVVWLGPALGPGGLFSLDLILPPDVPVPRGVWGLGPELPRRVPFMVPAAWLSPLVGGANVGKAMLVGTMTLAFVGAYRLVVARSRLAAVGAGMTLALSPFLLTRLAAGHVMIATTMALLPWAYPRLLRPAERLDRTYLWCLALACTGNYGGMVALVVLAAGLVHTRFRRTGPVLGLWLVAQLPWLVPGIVVYSQGANLAGAVGFATVADGPGDLVAVLGGHGFWNGYYQVGWTWSWVVAPLALALLALAVVGHRDLPAAWRTPAAVLATIGAVVALSTAVPGLSTVATFLTDNPIGSNLRESQRLLPLYLVWLAPAAGLGAARLARRLAAGVRPRPGLATLVTGVPAAVALVLAGPGIWGLGGHLAAVDMPADWQAARDRITAEPGTTVAFPWATYTNVRLREVRHVLNPWPIFLGGDVVVSSDLRTSTDASTERADPREVIVRRLADDVEEGRPVSDRLADLGVRWVVFNRVGDYLPYESLDRDPGLERVLAGNDVFLYRVRDWAGPAVDGQGRPTDLRSVLEPLALADDDQSFTWARPAASGWLRGWTPLEPTPEGTLHAPAGGRVVWYWPTVVVLLADAACLGAAVVAVRAGRRRPRPTGAATGFATPSRGSKG